MNSSIFNALDMISINPMSIKHVRQTNELCILAVMTDGLALEFIKDKTYEICEWAVLQNPLAMEFVPDNISLSINVLQTIVKKNYRCVKYINDPYIWQYALDITYNAFFYIQSTEIINYALSKNGELLWHIKNPTNEQCKIAVQTHGMVLERCVQSKYLQLKAVKSNGMALQFIDYPTTKIKIAAVRQNGRAIRFINQPSRRLCKIAVKQTGLAIQFIKNPSANLCKLAVQRSYKAIQFVDQTHELCIMAYKKSIKAIKLIKNKSRGFNMFILNRNPYMITKMEQTYELCMYITKLTANSLYYINEKFHIPAIIDSALNYEPVQYMRIKYKISLKEAIRIVQKFGNNGASFKHIVRLKRFEKLALFNNKLTRIEHKTKYLSLLTKSINRVNESSLKCPELFL
jgi:hypothetical protein